VETFARTLGKIRRTSRDTNLLVEMPSTRICYPSTGCELSRLNRECKKTQKRRCVLGLLPKAKTRWSIPHEIAPQRFRMEGDTTRPRMLYAVGPFELARTCDLIAQSQREPDRHSGPSGSWCGTNVTKVKALGRRVETSKEPTFAAGSRCVFVSGLREVKSGLVMSLISRARDASRRPRLPP
jgi:hypothetical protein